MLADFIHNTITPINNYTCEQWMNSSIANDRVFIHSLLLSSLFHPFIFIHSSILPIHKKSSSLLLLCCYNFWCMHAYAMCRLCHSRSFHSHRWFQCNAFLFAFNRIFVLSRCADLLFWWDNVVLLQSVPLSATMMIFTQRKVWVVLIFAGPINALNRMNKLLDYLIELSLCTFSFIFNWSYDDIWFDIYKIVRWNLFLCKKWSVFMWDVP